MRDWVMRAADDLHVHLRDDVRSSAAIQAIRLGGSSRVLAMPNTQPAILSGADAVKYRDWLHRQGLDVELLMTIKLTADTTPEIIIEAARLGAVAGKLYPLGVTTNSEDGLQDPMFLAPVFEAMQQVDMVLSLHGEVPGVFVMDAESAFLPHLDEINSCFPNLRVVLEHITTKDAVDFVKKSASSCLAATITDHHLEITLSDVVGSRIRPHHFCMPVAKRPDDLKALIEVVRSGDPRFFSGSDSAPHLIHDKQSDCGCAGIFSSPYHMQVLASIFSRCDMMPRLEAFTSQHGANFYGLDVNSQQICLKPKSWKVPDRFGGIVPFMAGKMLDYELEWL